VLGVRSGEGKEVRDGALVRDGVGVEEEQKLAVRLLGRTVDPEREAEVLGGGDQPDVRELRPHHLDGAVV
jgi:hypothetical protein